MLKHLSLSCLLFALMCSSSVFAQGNKKIGTIESAHDAKKGERSCALEEMTPVEIHTSLKVLNCFKTEDGGDVELTLKSNLSRLTIGENSLVSINDVVEKDGDGNFIIRKGYMGFKVQKNKDQKVEFETGTAAASIRGTEGFIGGYDYAFFAGLKNGKLFIQPKNRDSLEIGAGETVVGKGEFVVLKLKSSGDMDFAKLLNKIIADSTLSLEDLKTAVIKADSLYQEMIASKAAAAVPVATDSAMATALKIPQIKYSSYDSLRCVANISVFDVQKGTEARLSALMDGTPISEVALKRNMSRRVALRSGVHEYEFVVENDAGHNSVKKTLGCYPMKPFSVKIFGERNEKVDIPPAPPGADDVITQILQFQIRVPEYDPSFLNKVTVRQNGKVILQERLSQIQNLDYQIPVELQRGHKNRFDVEVIHKSGYAVKATKFYGAGK